MLEARLSHGVCYWENYRKTTYSKNQSGIKRIRGNLPPTHVFDSQDQFTANCFQLSGSYITMASSRQTTHSKHGMFLSCVNIANAFVLTLTGKYRGSNKLPTNTSIDHPKVLLMASPGSSRCFCLADCSDLSSQGQTFLVG